MRNSKTFNSYFNFVYIDKLLTFKKFNVSAIMTVNVFYYLIFLYSKFAKIYRL